VGFGRRHNDLAELDEVRQYADDGEHDDDTKHYAELAEQRPLLPLGNWFEFIEL
jgi:hypothetical protein